MLNEIGTTPPNYRCRSKVKTKPFREFRGLLSSNNSRWCPRCRSIKIHITSSDKNSWQKNPAAFSDAKRSNFARKFEGETLPALATMEEFRSRSASEHTRTSWDVGLKEAESTLTLWPDWTPCPSTSVRWRFEACPSKACPSYPEAIAVVSKSEIKSDVVLLCIEMRISHEWENKQLFEVYSVVLPHTLADRRTPKKQSYLASRRGWIRLCGADSVTWWTGASSKQLPTENRRRIDSATGGWNWPLDKCFWCSSFSSFVLFLVLLLLCLSHHKRKHFSWHSKITASSHDTCPGRTGCSTGSKDKFWISSGGGCSLWDIFENLWLCEREEGLSLRWESPVIILGRLQMAKMSRGEKIWLAKIASGVCPENFDLDGSEDLGYHSLFCCKTWRTATLL